MCILGEKNSRATILVAGQEVARKRQEDKAKGKDIVRWIG
jgi:hypothetical protein